MSDSFDKNEFSGAIRHIDQTELSAERIRKGTGTLTRDEITLHIGEVFGLDLTNAAGRQRLRQMVEYLARNYDNRDRSDEIRRWAGGFYDRKEKIESVLRWAEGWMGAGGKLVSQVAGLAIALAFSALCTYFMVHLK